MRVFLHNGKAGDEKSRIFSVYVKLQTVYLAKFSCNIGLHFAQIDFERKLTV